MGGYKERGAIVFSVVPKARGNGCKLKREISFRYKEKLFSCEGGQTLPQFSQRGHGIPVLRDIQNPTGHRPEEPALGDPALRLD